jgi:hypothetical protein
LRQKQVNAEGAGVHLINHVEQTTARLWTEMNKIMVDEFQYGTLTQLQTRKI